MDKKDAKSTDESRKLISEQDEVLQLMQGNYVRLSQFGPQTDEYANVVANDTFSFRSGVIADPRSKWNTVAFSLERNENLTAFEAWNIKLDPDSAGRKDCIFHTEDVDGRQLRFISDMGFEYDGRGRIVISTMIHEDDKPFVSDDFETELYNHYNNVKAAPQMNPFFGGAMPTMPMGMMFMNQGPAMGMMGMNQGMTMGMSGTSQGLPADMSGADASNASKSEETITCPACKMQVKKANFCRECGNPLK